MIIVKCHCCEENLAINGFCYDAEQGTWVMYVDTGCECNDDAFMDGLMDSEEGEEDGV